MIFLPLMGMVSGDELSGTTVCNIGASGQFQGIISAVPRLPIEATTLALRVNNSQQYNRPKMLRNLNRFLTTSRSNSTFKPGNEPIVTFEGLEVASFSFKLHIPEGIHTLPLGIYPISSLQFVTSQPLVGADLTTKVSSVDTTTTSPSTNTIMRIEWYSDVNEAETVDSYEDYDVDSGSPTITPGTAFAQPGSQTGSVEHVTPFDDIPSLVGQRSQAGTTSDQPLIVGIVPTPLGSTTPALTPPALTLVPGLTTLGRTTPAVTRRPSAINPVTPTALVTSWSQPVVEKTAPQANASVSIIHTGSNLSTGLAPATTPVSTTPALTSVPGLTTLGLTTPELIPVDVTTSLGASIPVDPAALDPDGSQPVVVLSPARPNTTEVLPKVNEPSKGAPVTHVGRKKRSIDEDGDPERPSGKKTQPVSADKLPNAAATMGKQHVRVFLPTTTTLPFTAASTSAATNVMGAELNVSGVQADDPTKAGSTKRPPIGAKEKGLSANATAANPPPTNLSSASTAATGASTAASTAAAALLLIPKPAAINPNLLLIIYIPDYADVDTTSFSELYQVGYS